MPKPVVFDQPRHHATTIVRPIRPYTNAYEQLDDRLEHRSTEPRRNLNHENGRPQSERQGKQRGKQRNRERSDNHGQRAHRGRARCIGLVRVPRGPREKCHRRNAVDEKCGQAMLGNHEHKRCHKKHDKRHARARKRAAHIVESLFRQRCHCLKPAFQTYADPSRCEGSPLRHRALQACAECAKKPDRATCGRAEFSLPRAWSRCRLRRGKPSCRKPRCSRFRKPGCPGPRRSS